ncbi:MAG: amidohydrolase family protein [Armatimonadota bacterium]
MQIWDCHVHCRGGETADDTLKAMDAAGLTRINLFARYPGNPQGECLPPLRESYRETIEHVAALQDAAPDRIYGLFWPDPRSEGVLEDIEYALVDRGLRGLKMIPNHWSPCDEFMFPIYEKVQELGKVIQFHSGILYGFGDSSRFCRPVLYEALLHFPNLKFSLAHIGWPWVDECIATWGHFRSASGYGKKLNQMWIDCSRGTPDAWRLEAMRKVIPFCGTGQVMYGTDATPGSLAQYAPEHIRKDRDILTNEIGVSGEQLEQFFWGAAEALFA